MARALVPRKSDMPDRKRFPKNNQFCYRWRVVDNFSKTIEREMFEQHLNGGQFHQSLQNERILALYKMTYRRRKNDFISQLTQDAMTFLENRRNAVSIALNEESAYTKSMVNLIDSVFNLLLSCSIELNTVLGFSELFVAATEPEVQTYHSNGQTRVRSLNCRFSTSVFSLVLHGQKDKIHCYVVPVEDLLGSRNPAGEHEPLAVCSAEFTDGTPKWNVEMDVSDSNEPYSIRKKFSTHEMSDENMENLCHYLLRHLIDKTQLVLSNSQAVGF